MYRRKIYYNNIVKKMRVNTRKYIQQCNIEQNPLKKSIICKHYLNSVEWSFIMEKYLKNKFSLINSYTHNSGDGITQNGKNIEIKVSLGDAKGKFNFVNLRPYHNIDYYLFMCYNLYEKKYGKVYIFICKSSKIYSLLPKYGEYAQGNITTLGPITKQSIIKNKKKYITYVLRPNPNQINTKSKELWDKLIKYSIISDYKINKIFGNTKFIHKKIE